MVSTRTTPKSKWVKFRISAEDQMLLQQKAALSGRTVSDLIRESLARSRTWTLADKETELARIRQIARIGNNLNQIAKWANTFKTRAEAVQVIAHLIAIEQTLLILFPVAGKKER